MTPQGALTQLPHLWEVKGGVPPQLSCLLLLFPLFRDSLLPMNRTNVSASQVSAILTLTSSSTNIPRSKSGERYIPAARQIVKLSLPRARSLSQFLGPGEQQHRLRVRRITRYGSFCATSRTKQYPPKSTTTSARARVDHNGTSSGEYWW